MYQLYGKIEGADSLTAALKAGGEFVSQELSSAIMRTAFHVEGKAKALSPTDTSNLRGSIHTEGPIGFGAQVEARVGTNVKYASYQEKGTGIYGGNGIITPKRAKVLAWKKNGQWIFAKQVKGVRGKWFMKQAKIDGISFLNEELKVLMSKVTQFLAK